MGGRILVVDDDRAFVEAVAIYLQDHGFEVLKTYTGREAVSACMRRIVDVAVVVDVHLPDIEGVEVVTQLQRWQPSVSAVLISSDDSTETTRRCRSSPAATFMAKPLIPAQLLETISRAIHMSGRNCVTHS